MVQLANFIPEISIFFLPMVPVSIKKASLRLEIYIRMLILLTVTTLTPRENQAGGFIWNFKQAQVICNVLHVGWHKRRRLI